MSKLHHNQPCQALSRAGAWAGGLWLWLWAFAAVLPAQETYQKPPTNILEILGAPPAPVVSFSPSRDRFLESVKVFRRVLRPRSLRLQHDTTWSALHVLFVRRNAIDSTRRRNCDVGKHLSSVSNSQQSQRRRDVSSRSHRTAIRGTLRSQAFLAKSSFCDFL